MIRMYDKLKFITIQDLLDMGYPVDKPMILIDPDTEWRMYPMFIEDAEEIFITADYGRLTK